VCEGFAWNWTSIAKNSKLHETTRPAGLIRETAPSAAPDQKVGLAEKPALTGCGGLVTAIVWLAPLVARAVGHGQCNGDVSRIV